MSDGRPELRTRGVNRESALSADKSNPANMAGGRRWGDIAHLSVFPLPADFAVQWERRTLNPYKLLGVETCGDVRSYSWRGRGQLKVALTVIAFVVLALVAAGWLVGLVQPATRTAALVVLAIDLGLAFGAGWMARGDCAPTRSSSVCLCGGCHKDEKTDDEEPVSAPQGHCCQGCSGGCGGSRL